MTVTAVQNKTVYHFTKKLLFSMDEVIFSKNLRNNNLNCDSKKFFPQIGGWALSLKCP